MVMTHAIMKKPKTKKEAGAMRNALFRTRTRRGITPVIAVILLLLMTVAAAGGAFLWITKFSDMIKIKVNEREQHDLRCQTTFLSVDDIHGTGSDLAFVLRNSGTMTMTAEEWKKTSITVTHNSDVEVQSLGFNGSGSTCEAKALGESDKFTYGMYSLVVCTGLFGTPAEGDSFSVKAVSHCNTESYSSIIYNEQ